MDTASSSTDTMPRQNLYRVLNVSPTASVEELKKAINEELRLWSNRTNAPQIERRQEAERMVKLLDQAEAILLDLAKRTAYDRQLATMPTQERDIDDSDLAGNKDLVQEARRLLSEGEVPDALYVAEKATQQAGNNAEAWAVLAQAKFRWGNIEDAIYEYKRALKLRPNEATYYFDYGTVLESAGRPADALREYQRAAQIDPGTAMYRAAVGSVLVKAGQSREGAAILEKCVEEELGNESYQWFLAIAYVDSAADNWTRVSREDSGLLPPGLYATEKWQVLEAQSFIEKAEKMKFDDDSLREHIRQCKMEINNNLQRQFYGSYLAPILGAIGWTAVCGLGLVFGPLYFFAARPPRYAIAKRLLQSKVPVAERLRGDTAEETLIYSAFVGAFLPVMTIWNYIKNYTGENALPKMSK